MIRLAAPLSSFLVVLLCHSLLFVMETSTTPSIWVHAELNISLNTKMQWDFSVLPCNSLRNLHANDSFGYSVKMTVPENGRWIINSRDFVQPATSNCSSNFDRQILTWSMSFQGSSVTVNSSGQKINVIPLDRPQISNTSNSLQNKTLIKIEMATSVSQKIQSSLIFFNIKIEGKTKPVQFFERNGSLHQSFEWASAICNKGSFTETGSCNCSMVPLNGRHCNDSLDSYGKSEFYFLDVPNETNGFDMKLSWSVENDENYCLLHLSGSGRDYILHLDGGTVFWTMVGKDSNVNTQDTIMNNTKTMGTYFVRLKIEGSNFIVFTEGYSERYQAKISNNLLIAVGYTMKSMKKPLCIDFHGKMSLDDESSATTNIAKKNAAMNYHSTPLRDSTKEFLIIVVASCSTGSLFVFVVSLVFYYIFGRKLKKDVSKTVRCTLHTYETISRNVEMKDTQPPESYSVIYDYATDG